MAHFTFALQYFVAYNAQTDAMPKVKYTQTGHSQGNNNICRHQWQHQSQNCGKLFLNKNTRKTENQRVISSIFDKSLADFVTVYM